MSNVPSKTTALRWGGLASSGSNNEEDLLQIQSPQKVIQGWIDSSGTPWGNLATPGPPGPQGPAGTSNVPWFDVQDFGAKPRLFDAGPPPTTTATTFGTADVTLAAAKDFVNGDGLVIFAAGAATSQSTPSAPTLTSPAVGGSGTYNYKIIGVDALGGLTAASSAAQITSGPNVFGNLPVVISSISQTSNVVTVQFSTPINAVAGMQIAITNVTGNGTIFNGFWAVASAPTTSSVTFALSGTGVTGTVGATSMGRLCNTFTIASISRSGTTISITTNANHGFQVQSGTKHTIVIVDGVTPYDLNGQYVVTSASGNSLTCALLAVSSTETGSVSASSTATVYEYVTVKCPAVSGTTVAYYVYGDYGTGIYQLLGRTLPLQQTFFDWGPWLMAGFFAPSYVPTTPPASAQNQMYAGTIVSGAGTTSLVVTPSVPASGSGLTVMHDEGVCINDAIAACVAVGGGTVFVSPGDEKYLTYYVNSPIIVSSLVTLSLGCAMIWNETLTQDSFTSLMSMGGPQSPNEPSFGFQNYVAVSGLGSPLLNIPNGAAYIAGIQFSCTHNNQWGVVVYGDEVQFERCFFNATASAAVPLIIEGGTTEARLTSCSFLAPSNITTTSGAGTISYAPYIPALWLRSDDVDGQTNSNFQMDGINNFSGRGIFYDCSLVTTGDSSNYIFDAYEFQAPVTPFLMMMGSNTGQNISVRHVVMDSAVPAVIANWVSGEGVYLTEVDSVFPENGDTGIVTGYFIPGLKISRLMYDTNVNQNYDTSSACMSASLTTNGATSYVVTLTGLTPNSHVSITPTNASAAADIASGSVYVSTKALSQVTIITGSTSGETFDILATVN